MKNVLLFFVLFGSLTFHGVHGLICPEDDIISPCTCREDNISCQGPQVTQESINRAFNTIRHYNSLHPFDRLKINKFFLGQSPLTRLDLTPFLHLTCEEFRVEMNEQLTTIVGPGWPIQGSIQINYYLGFYHNDLTDKGFGDLLKYFGPSIRLLDLESNSLQGSGGKQRKFDSEFLPGLSRLTKLQTLILSHNKITKLDHKMFYKNHQLKSINLFDNPNLAVGKDGLSFSDSNSTDLLIVSLFSCGLNETSLNMKENGLLNLQRPVQLVLLLNNFEVLSAENFEIFLKANKLNTIEMTSNPLICDQRMKWLKDGKDIYQGRVFNAYCSNDPAHDVFTTSLIQ